MTPKDYTPNMVLSVDGWNEFAELFKNRDFAEHRI